MLEIASVDLEMLATALSDQGYESRWLFDPAAGSTGYRGSDEVPEDEDEDDAEDGGGLIAVDPLPSYVWYQDMADFAELVSDERTGRRLARALDGKGAFRRFKNEIYEEYPELIGVWHAFRDNRAAVRAVDWLLDQGLVSLETFEEFRSQHPDPPVP